MNYKQELINKVKNPDNWPAFERPDFLDNLNAVADEVFQKATIEGYLAALLIYHQICDELVRLILEDTQFYMQLALFPVEIYFPEMKRKVMFGQLIDELKSTVSFKKRDEFIEKCLELNRNRNDTVHQLTRKTTLLDVKRQASKAKSLFDEIFALFEGAHDFFSASFSDFQDDAEDWDEY